MGNVKHKLHKLNPAEAFNLGLEQGRTKGISDGFIAFSALAIVAAYNVEDEETTNEDFKEWAERWEAETLRIFREEYEYKPDEILCKVADLRKRLNLSELGG